MLRTLLVFFCLIACQPGALLGQLLVTPDPDKWEVSFFGGFGTLRGRDSFLTAQDGGGPSPVFLDSQSGYVLGLRVSENLGRHFGAEFEYSFADRPIDLTNLSPQLQTFSLDQRIHNFTYNGLLYPLGRSRAFRPFATAGIGASLFQLAGDTAQRGVAAGLDLRNRWQLAFTWGAGVKYRVGEKWGVRFDFRDHITNVPDYGIPRESMTINGIQTPAFRPDGQFHDLQFTAGLIYAFSSR